MCVGLALYLFDVFSKQKCPQDHMENALGVALRTWNQDLETPMGTAISESFHSTGWS